MIEILSYKPEMARELTAVYDKAVRPVPHCYSVSAEDFAGAVAKPEALDDRWPPLHSQEAFVATQGDRIVGLIDCGIRPPKEPDEGEQGMIRMFWYERGRRAVGQALLERAEEYLGRRGVNRAEAFNQHYTYPFYQLHSSYLSDRLEQVAALLGFNGYRRIAGEVFLDWPDLDLLGPTKPGLSAEIAVHWRETPGRRPVVTVKAVQGGKEIGVCTCDRIADYTSDEAARDWFFTSWLGVEREHQGQGLGKYLLQRALMEMRGAGYRHAAISTAWDNYRAFVFYSNVGYHVVDWTYGLSRKLG